MFFGFKNQYKYIEILHNQERYVHLFSIRFWILDFFNSEVQSKTAAKKVNSCELIKPFQQKMPIFVVNFEIKQLTKL